MPTALDSFCLHFERNKILQLSDKIGYCGREAYVFWGQCNFAKTCTNIHTSNTAIHLHIYINLLYLLDTEKVIKQNSLKAKRRRKCTTMSKENWRRTRTTNLKLFVLHIKRKLGCVAQHRRGIE